ncbi:hypothetical protein LEMLEM_LOCUS25850, partial [Lemmus lemmus]
ASRRLWELGRQVGSGTFSRAAAGGAALAAASRVSELRNCCAGPWGLGGKPSACTANPWAPRARVSLLCLPARPQPPPSPPSPPPPAL